MSATPQAHVIRHIRHIGFTIALFNTQQRGLNVAKPFACYAARGCDNLVGRDSVEPTNKLDERH